MFGRPDGDRTHGYANMPAISSEMMAACEDFSMNVDQLLADGDLVFVRWTQHGIYEIPDDDDVAVADADHGVCKRCLSRRCRKNRRVLDSGGPARDAASSPKRLNCHPERSRGTGSRALAAKALRVMIVDNTGRL